MTSVGLPIPNLVDVPLPPAAPDTAPVVSRNGSLSWFPISYPTILPDTQSAQGSGLTAELRTTAVLPAVSPIAPPGSRPTTARNDRSTVHNCCCPSWPGVAAMGGRICARCRTSPGHGPGANAISRELYATFPAEPSDRPSKRAGCGFRGRASECDHGRTFLGEDHRSKSPNSRASVID